MEPPPVAKRGRSESTSDHEDKGRSASDKISRYAKVPKPRHWSKHNFTPAIATRKEVQTVEEALAQLELRWPGAKAVVEACIVEHTRRQNELVSSNRSTVSLRRKREQGPTRSPAKNMIRKVTCLRKKETEHPLLDHQYVVVWVMNFFPCCSPADIGPLSHMCRCRAGYMPISLSQRAMELPALLLKLGCHVIDMTQIYSTPGLSVRTERIHHAVL